MLTHAISLNTCILKHFRQLKNKLTNSSNMRLILLAICCFQMVGCASNETTVSQICSTSPVYGGPALLNSFSPVTKQLEKINTDRLIEDDLAQSLDKLFFRLVEDQTDATHASIAVWSPKNGYWSSNFTDTQAENSDIFWWASVGKLITASIVLQLVEEGKVSLNDSLSNWFPNYPNSKLITIDHLLTHTGGVFSFNHDLKYQEKRGHIPLESLIEISARHGADFCPGSNWNYSNTGYVMLGRIAELIEGRPLENLVSARISQTAQPKDLVIVKKDAKENAIVVPGGQNAPALADIASLYGAGAFKGTAIDMLHVLHSYLNANIVSLQMRNMALTDLYPMYGTEMFYGRGVMVIVVPDKDAPTFWVGHSGGSPNSKALLVYDVKRDVFLSLVLNIQAPAEAIANAILKKFDSAE